MGSVDLPPPAIERLLRLRRLAVRAHPDPNAPTSLKGAREARAWARADRGLLNAWRSRGWLQRTPACFDLPPSQASQAMVVGTGWQAVASNAWGDPVGALPTAAEAWAVLARAHAVGHEAGHAAIAQHPDPFTAPGWTPSQVQAMNRWRLGPWSVGPTAPVRRLWHECFADLWAVAALLEWTDHAASTRAFAHALVAWRAEGSRAAEHRFARSAARASPTLVPFGGVHHTHPALARLLAAAPSWRGTPPHALVPTLQDLASQAVLEWVHPHRLTAAGVPLGPAAAQHLVGPAGLDVARAVLHRAACTTPEALAAWRNVDHPALEAVQVVWPAVEREMATWPASRRLALHRLHQGPPSDERAARAAVAGLRLAAAQALRASAGSPEVRQAVRVHAQDRERLRAVLDPPCTPPRPRSPRRSP